MGGGAEARAAGRRRRAGHQDRAGVSERHQPSGEVGPVTERTEGERGIAAVDPGARHALGEADANGTGCGEVLGEVAEGQGRAGRSGGDVLMGVRGPEGGVEVAGLVPDRHLQQRPVERGEDGLDPADEGVEGLCAVRCVEGERGELEEERHRRPKLGGQVAEATAQRRCDECLSHGRVHRVR